MIDPKRIEEALKEEGYGVMMTLGETARAMKCTTRNVARHRKEGRIAQSNSGGTGQALFLRSDVAELIAGTS